MGVSQIMLNNKELYIIIGAGGHAQVIIDILHKSEVSIKGLIDNSDKKHGTRILGEEVLGGFDIIDQFKHKCKFLIGIGDNKIRCKIGIELIEKECQFGTAIHPNCILGEDVVIGSGTVIMAGTVINSGTKIGENCIINTSVSLDHDNIIGDYVHLSPGNVTGGMVRIGKLTWVGLGSRIINNITIGESTIIGAGSVVIKDIPSHVMAAGVPAKVKKKI